MKVILHDEENLEFHQFNKPALEIEPENPQLQYSALQMFATSLAICTYSILTGYAEQIEASVENLFMTVKWQYSEHPTRIKHIDMDIHWPELPESRLLAAQRAASYCPLHQTLENPPEVVTTVSK
jgi:uncharacterized OsmC-like protein